MPLIRRTVRTFIASLGLSIVLVNLYHYLMKSSTPLEAISSTMSQQTPVTLLGTQYEGGGGLIRDALTYSSLLNKSMTINSIRANRPGTGGLRAEHTVAIGTMAFLSGALVEGNETASRQLIFKPREGLVKEDIKTVQDLDIAVEGSAAILMIAILPYILFSSLGIAAHMNPTIPKDGIWVTIRAGTLCVKAPSFFALQQVFIPTMRMIGIGEENLRLSTDHDQGWHTDFVKAPGRIKLWVKPLTHPLKAFILAHRGRLAQICITAYAPEDEFEQFGAIVKQEVKNSLKDSKGEAEKVTVKLQTLKSTIAGQYHLLLVGETVAPEAYLGYEQVYPQTSGFPNNLAKSKGSLYKHLARVCLLGLINELKSGNSVDENIQDMMTVYQSLADGFSSVTAPVNGKIVRDEVELRIPLSEQVS